MPLLILMPHSFMNGPQVKVALSVACTLFLTLITGGLVESDSPLPDFVPNTHPDEPSLPATAEKAPPEPDDVRRKSPSPSPSPPPMFYGLPLPPPPSKVCRYITHADLLDLTSSRLLFAARSQCRRRPVLKNPSCSILGMRLRRKI